MKKILTLFHPWPLFFGYGLVSLFLFLYSWTQIDLGLTLTQLSIWQTIQKAFQNIGYFQRPLSTTLFISIIIGLFSMYAYALFCIQKKLITIQSLRALIFFIFILLVFSYPAFSYDFFNYMFTAKTILIYHKNPYIVTPLQFNGFESWLSFLHWTHLPSAYAPFWIMVTLLPYILGFGYFLLILWNLKLTVGLFYLLTAWGIKEILQDENEIKQLTGIALFALNPLILVESLVSGHNDIAMSALGIVALLILWRKKHILSFFILSMSIALKEITLVLIPLYVLRNKNRIWPLICMSFGLIFFLVYFKREMLPWYGVWIIPFVAIIPNLPIFIPIVFGFSIGLLLYYSPYLYYGHWNDPVPFLKFWLTVLPIMITLLYSILQIFYKNATKKVTVRKQK